VIRWRVDRGKSWCTREAGGGRGGGQEARCVWLHDRSQRARGMPERCGTEARKTGSTQRGKKILARRVVYRDV